MSKDKHGWLQVNTDEMPERDRFPFFHEEMGNRVMALNIAKHDDTPYRAKLELSQAGQIALSALTTSPAEYVRTPALVRDGVDTLVAVLCLRGDIHLTQGQHQTVTAGQAVLCDSAQVGGLVMSTDSRHWCVVIPRAKLRPYEPHIELRAGTRLNNGGLALRLLAGYLKELRTQDLCSDAQASTLAGDHLVEMVALALGASGPAREVIERGGLRAGRRSAVLQEIDRNLENAELSAATIARQFGITPRYVHMLMEDMGLTFSEYVLEKRLNKADRLLQDGTRHGHKIADVAGEVGFSDLSHFNRSFRRRFGETPSSRRLPKPRSDRR